MPLKRTSFKMENFETLNSIAEEFHIKKQALKIFGLDDLFERGSHYVTLHEEPPTFYNSKPDILMEEESQTFCSIFSEDKSKSKIKSDGIISQNVSLVKLISQGDILTSEFDTEDADPVLTSQNEEQNNQET